MKTRYILPFLLAPIYAALVTGDVAAAEDKPSPESKAGQHVQQLKGKVLEVHLENRFRATVHAASQFEVKFASNHTKHLIRSLTTLHEQQKLIRNLASLNRDRFERISETIGKDLPSLFAAGELKHAERIRELYGSLHSQLSFDPADHDWSNDPLFGVDPTYEQDLTRLFAGDTPDTLDEQFSYRFHAAYLLIEAKREILAAHEIDRLVALLPPTWVTRSGKQRKLDVSIPPHYYNAGSFQDDDRHSSADTMSYLFEQTMTLDSELGRYRPPATPEHRSNELHFDAFVSYPDPVQIEKAAATLGSLLGEPWKSYPFAEHFQK